jgi:hypothetical protein
MLMNKQRRRSAGRKTVLSEDHAAPVASNLYLEALAGLVKFGQVPG